MNWLISTYGQTTNSIACNGEEVALRFNAKEKDYESGYHYYGARYYDSELLTGWLSVDPKADKYPSLSPYNYCVGNPVKIIDPDGNEIGDYYSTTGRYLGTDGLNDKKIYIAFGDDKKIQNQIKNGDFSFEKQYLINTDALEKIYNYSINSDNRNPNREYGGSIYQDANGNQFVYTCNPGPQFSIGEEFSSVIKHDWDNAYSFTGLILVTDFHTHHRDLIQFPSQQDRNNVLNESGERYGGASCPYNIMLAMGSRQLFFYNNQKDPIAKWSFNTVEKIFKRR